MLDWLTDMRLPLQTVEGSIIGPYRIKGTVTRMGEPVDHPRVLLINRSTGNLWNVVLSGAVHGDAVGDYVFDHVRRSGVYSVLAFDSNTEPVNAAISDYVTLDLTP